MFTGLPVVAIIAVYDNLYDAYGVAKTYVDWIKTAGCHVIYILASTPLKEMKQIVEQIDCLIIPGGSIHATPENETYKKTMVLLDLARKKNLPVVGICMGMQYMMSYSAKKHWYMLRTMVDSLQEVKPLHFINKIPYTNGIQAISPNTKTKMYFNHYEALLYDRFQQEGHLRNAYDVLTISQSLQNKDYYYVSTIKGKQLPWFGFQWHLERPEFELSKNENIPRTKVHYNVARAIAKEIMAHARLVNSKTYAGMLRKYNINRLKVVQGNLPVQSSNTYYDPTATFFVIEDAKRYPKDTKFTWDDHKI